MVVVTCIHHLRKSIQEILQDWYPKWFCTHYLNQTGDQSSNFMILPSLSFSLSPSSELINCTFLQLLNLLSIATLRKLLYSIERAQTFIPWRNHHAHSTPFQG